MRKYAKACANLFITLTILLLVILVVPRGVVFFAPFVAGWILALIASPLVRFFEEKIKLTRKIGSAFVIIAVIAVLVLIIYFVSAWLVDQVVGLVRALPSMWSGLEADLTNIGNNLDKLLPKLSDEKVVKLDLNKIFSNLGESIGEFIGRLGSPTIEAAGNVAKQLPSVFIGLIMALLSAYFFVAEGSTIREWFEQHTPAIWQKRYLMIRRSLVKSVGGYFKAQFKIEIWMYFLLLVGLGILGVNYFALIALVIAFMDFLPFLGTGTILVPWALVRLTTADYKMSIGLLIIWGVGQLARQLIQPKIVGDSVGIAPLPTLILLFIGYKVGSVVGMILAVPIGLLVFSMYEEGVFDTAKQSVMVLTAGVNGFRRLNKEDLYEVEEMKQQNQKIAEQLRIQRQEAQQQKQEAQQQKRENKHNRRKGKNEHGVQ